MCGASGCRGGAIGGGFRGGHIWSQQLVGTECLSVFLWNQLLRFQEADVVFLGSRAKRGCSTQAGTVRAPTQHRKHTSRESDLRLNKFCRLLFGSLCFETDLEESVGRNCRVVVFVF